MSILRYRLGRQAASGRAGGRLRSIPIGSEVFITHVFTDGNAQERKLLQRVEGIYLGSVYDSNTARVRLKSFDRRFIGQNISADGSTIELQVEVRFLERKNAFARLAARFGLEE